MSARCRSPFAFAVLVAAIVYGCTAPEDANPSPRCDEGACPQGMYCYRGFCLPAHDAGAPMPPPDAGAGPIDAGPPPDPCGGACADDEVCMAGTCCKPDRLACGGECVDPNKSALHCGGCGIACASGEVCDHGVCQED